MAFNPHSNRTSDGKVVTEGMTVLDYDYREGVVIADRYGTMHEHGHCGADHWFEVRHADGSTKDFNGDRLRSR